MANYVAGSRIQITIPFTDHDGTDVTVTGLTAVLEDDEGTELATYAQTPGGSDTQAIITIATDKNTLASGVVSAGRALHVTLTTATHSIVTSVYYGLVSTQMLVVPTNSFQTFTQAIGRAAQMHDVDIFSAATDTLKKNALLEAHRRLTRFAYRLTRQTTLDRQAYLDAHLDYGLIYPGDWPSLTLAEFNDFPADFLEAIKFAQIVESNGLLTTGTPEEKRKLGLMSESIGESSMMFRPGKPANMGLQDNTFDMMRGFIDRQLRIGRA